MAKLLLGKEVTEALNAELKTRTAALRARGIIPTLAIVRLGEDPSDLSYERGALKRADAVGVTVRQFLLPREASAEEVLAVIDGINEDPAIHGCLLFRPLPKHLRSRQYEICNRLDPKKDVDCMTHISGAGVFEGLDLGYPPCTAAACMEVLHHYGIDPKGKNVAVIGRSLVVGKPVAMMLMGENATVTVCHTKTRDTAAICRSSDIIVSAAGVLNSLTADFVHPGQTVIDVSINWDEQKSGIAGDAKFDDVAAIVDAITPVPGGVGAVTTSVLMKHTVLAAEKV